MMREDFPATHPGCPAEDAPVVIPIYLHRGEGGLYAHYVCLACGGWTNRWCARVTPDRDGNRTEKGNPVKITPKRTLALAAIPFAAVLLAGCGSFASSHDNAKVNQEIKDGQTTVVTSPGPVTRIDTPGNFPAVVRVCVGFEGVYVAGDGGSSTFVVTYDPGCGWKGTPQSPAK